MCFLSNDKVTFAIIRLYLKKDTIILLYFAICDFVMICWKRKKQLSNNKKEKFCLDQPSTVLLIPFQ